MQKEHGFQFQEKFQRLLDLTRKIASNPNLNVDEDKWFYCQNDGYFYYKTILTDESEPVELFTEVTIPEELDNEWSLEEISIDVRVEAIQSRNFTPDFSDGQTEPWPGITESDIQECIYPDHVKV